MTCVYTVSMGQVYFVLAHACLAFWHHLPLLTAKHNTSCCLLWEKKGEVHTTQFFAYRDETRCIGFFEKPPIASQTN